MDKVYKLDPEVKAKWVAALRSGKYKQGKGYLHHGERYCCLGVLCEHVLGLKPEWAGDIAYYHNGSIDSAAVIPGGAAGSNFESGGTLNTFLYVTTTSDGYQTREIHSLWELNDVAGWNFNQIADVIEEQF